MAAVYHPYHRGVTPSDLRKGPVLRIFALQDHLQASDLRCNTVTGVTPYGGPGGDTAPARAERALVRVRRKAKEYERVRRIVGAPAYPSSNRCARCGAISDHPLIPYRDGWRCRACTYVPVHTARKEAARDD